VSKINSFRPKKIYDNILEQRKQDGIDFYNLYHKEFVEIDCPACGHKGEFEFEKWGFEHRKCPECKTLYTSPRPNEDRIIHYYNDFSAPNMWTSLLLETDVERKKLQYKPRVDLIINHIDLNDNPVVADVGAGSGAFCMALEASGYFKKVYAVDVADKCIEACESNNLNTIKGSVEDLEDNSFDLITMNDLIEHVFNPKAFLEGCLNKLTVGGYLIIATPNGEGFDFKIMKDQTLNITPPEHINYFNPESIKHLMTDVGFTKVDAITPGILDVGIIQRSVENGFELEERNEWLAHLLTMPEGVLDTFQDFIAENNLSSHMLIFARK